MSEPNKKRSTVAERGIVVPYAMYNRSLDTLRTLREEAHSLRSENAALKAKLADIINIVRRAQA